MASRAAAMPLPVRRKARRANPSPRGAPAAGGGGVGREGVEPGRELLLLRRRRRRDEFLVGGDAEGDGRQQFGAGIEFRLAHPHGRLLDGERDSRCRFLPALCGGGFSGDQWWPWPWCPWPCSAAGGSKLTSKGRTCRTPW